MGGTKGFIVIRKFDHNSTQNNTVISLIWMSRGQYGHFYCIDIHFYCMQHMSKCNGAWHR